MPPFFIFGGTMTRWMMIALALAFMGGFSGAADARDNILGNALNEKADRGRQQPAYSPYAQGYGEVSEETGRVKDVHVDGYYRRDGTYVRPHYRSRPRR